MTIESTIRKKIEAVGSGDLPAITPGLCLQAVHRGKLVADLQMCRTWRYYDLASLTKIIFAVPAIMQLAGLRASTRRRARGERHPLHLAAPMQKYLPDWPHSTTRVREVLSHSAGLLAWGAFYKKIASRKFQSAEEKRTFVKRILFQSPIGSKRRAVYSDLDFILLGFLLEERYDRPLEEIWQNEIPWRARTPSLHFNKIDLHGRCKTRFARNQYAPTERCPWRKKILQGEVHDDNAWSFGGISTHAGLFGTINDVTNFGQLLRAAWRGQTIHGFPLPATIRQFTRRAIPRAVGDFALGFMLPTKGSASCGRYFSLSSFGHTGFTGTSLWYDPKRDLLVTLLSNRVHPTRENRTFVALRPKIHDIIVETIDGI